MVKQNNRVNQAIILAAGLGARLKPITDTTPKPLLQVNSKPILVYLIEALVKANIKKIIIHVSYLADQIIEQIGDARQWGLNVEVCYALSDFPLESGGGIQNSVQYLDINNDQDYFLCINGDIFTDYDFDKLVTNNLELLNIGACGHLVLVPNPPNKIGDYGIKFDKQSCHLTSQKVYTYSGIALYNYKLVTQYFNKIQEQKFSIKSYLDSNLNLFTASLFEGVWYDIGSLEMYRLVKERYES
jgi:MurNAc alpha-1-phosphate uridylyltransferase